MEPESNTPALVLLTVGEETVLLDNTLLQKTENRDTLMWRYRDISVALQCISFRPDTMIMEYGVANHGKTPAAISLRMVFDVVDYPAAQGLEVAGNSIALEFQMHGKGKSENLVIHQSAAGQEASKTMQLKMSWGTALTPAQAETIMISNVQRLKSLVRIPDVQEGRNFSYLPFSVNDRGVSFIFPEYLLIPGAQTTFYIPVSSAETSSAPDIVAFMKEKNASNTKIRQSTANSDLLEIERINDFLKQLNLSIEQGTFKQEDYEKALDQLERLRNRKVE